VQTVGPESRPSIGPCIDWVAIDSEIVIIDARDHLHLITGTGAMVWPLMQDGGLAIVELAKDVSSVFDIEVSVALHDLIHFVSDMLDVGLIDVMAA